jgi:hypothetical protein
LTPSLSCCPERSHGDFKLYPAQSDFHKKKILPRGRHETAPNARTCDGSIVNRKLLDGEHKACMREEAEISG